jgi:hypothetical protein
LRDAVGTLLPHHLTSLSVNGKPILRFAGFSIEPVACEILHCNTFREVQAWQVFQTQLDDDAISLGIFQESERAVACVVKTLFLNTYLDYFKERGAL